MEPATAKVLSSNTTNVQLPLEALLLIHLQCGSDRNSRVHADFINSLERRKLFL